MKNDPKDKVRLLGVLLLVAAAFFVYEKFTAPQVPRMDSGLVSFSKSVHFGAAIGAASGGMESGKDFVIDLDAAKKEIDLVYGLGADLVRFDLERRILEDAGEMAKLDEAASYAQGKKMKIYLAYTGRDDWRGSDEGAGKASWEDFKSGYRTDAVSLASRYKPDYFLILPDCPYGIGRQVNSRRAAEEWFEFAKETGLALKQASYATKVALGSAVVRGGDKAADMAFAASALGSNDAAINIFSMSSADAAELEEGMENLLEMKKKFHWEGEIWMGDAGNAAGPEAQRQKDLLLYALHLANSNGFSGIVLGRLRDGAGDGSGIVSENYSPKIAYVAIKEVMQKRR